MDAYIEESVDDANTYRNSTSYKPQGEADGLKSVNFLRQQFAVTENLTPTVGWSPDDVGATITRHHGTAKLDFAFIDAGHWDEALVRDTKAVAPHLGDRYVVLFHDTPSFGPAAKSFVESLFGIGWTAIPGLASNRGGFDMAFIARGVDVAPVLAHFQ
jgi:hypothetical protein